MHVSTKYIYLIFTQINDKIAIFFPNGTLKVSKNLIWGSVYERESTAIDAQGNLFLPTYGNFANVDYNYVLKLNDEL